LTGFPVLFMPKKSLHLFYVTNFRVVMKTLQVLAISALVAVILICGCTSTSPQAPSVTTSPPPQTVPVTTEQAPGTTAAATLSGTSWELSWFDDTKGIWSKVSEGSIVTARFGTDMKLTGSGGCNDYSVEYHLGTDPMIWIRRPEIGSKTCQSPLGVMKQEAAYYTDLSWAEDYSITDNQLAMFDKTGKKILSFDPA
jgi:heat shock protein HslJ